MPRTTPASTVERLARHLFDGLAGDPLVDEVSAWLTESSRFRAFADEHRDKIRKKLRGATDAEARRDVRAELRAAHLLLGDRRIELGFEAYGSGRGGPDFTVAFRGDRAFNLEVTRLRGVPGATLHGGPLLAKLRQLPPSVPNALCIGIDGDAAGALDVAAAVRSLRGRADAKDEAFFTTRGFDGSRGFYARFLRLGAVVAWCEGAPGGARTALWRNPSARIEIPERALRASVACLEGGGLS